MGKSVRSAKGQLIDFDLLKIKEQIAASPPTVDVSARQDFIDKRLRRRLKKVAKPPVEKVEVDVASEIAEGPEVPPTKDSEVEVKALPEVVAVEPPTVKEEEQKPVDSKQPKPKQKARKKKKTK